MESKHAIAWILFFFSSGAFLLLFHLYGGVILGQGPAPTPASPFFPTAVPSASPGIRISPTATQTGNTPSPQATGISPAAVPSGVFAVLPWNAEPDPAMWEGPIDG